MELKIKLIILIKTKEKSFSESIKMEINLTQRLIYFGNILIENSDMRLNEFKDKSKIEYFQNFVLFS